MKLVEWVRFSWDLDKLPGMAGTLPSHYSFTPATLADEKELRLVIRRCFAHDTSWGAVFHEIDGMIDGWFADGLDPDKPGICLALRHGVRMIGATILLPDPTRENHLAPGPCIVMEYRNRGLGTALLGESLRRLREVGLTRAIAVAKSNGPVAKFLYPKFSGVLIPADTPLLAA